MSIRPNPKPAPRASKARTPIPRKRTRARAYKTPRCTFGKGRCKRPQAVFVGQNGFCKSHARQEADRCWSEEVRSKGKCEAKGWAPTWIGAPPVQCGGPLQAAHGFPRTYAATRLIPLNGFALCAGHHRWFTTKPLHWTQFMIERLGTEPYEELRRLALSR